MKLLDLFCGAGGCSMGYYQAGFDAIDGVDLYPQKRYPFNFIQGDAFEYIEKYGNLYDVVHASPPCQGYMRGGLAMSNHPRLIGETRKALIETGKPYVIENVVGAPLINPIKLSGLLFGLLVIRERLFESNIPMEQPDLPLMTGSLAKMGRPPKPGQYVSVVGHVSDIAYCRKAMGIGWMSVKEISQAIPPAYTRWIGERIIRSIQNRQ